MILVLGKVETEEDNLQNYLKSFYSWSLEWQMVFNMLTAEMCKAVHFVHENKHISCEMGAVC